jgi:hypothetical protein
MRRNSDQAAQLAQAMAGFDRGGAADSSRTTFFAADTSQQSFLATSQHA